MTLHYYLPLSGYIYFHPDSLTVQSIWTKNKLSIDETELEMTNYMLVNIENCKNPLVNYKFLILRKGKKGKYFNF